MFLSVSLVLEKFLPTFYVLSACWGLQTFVSARLSEDTVQLFSQLETWTLTGNFFSYSVVVLTQSRPNLSCQSDKFRLDSKILSCQLRHQLPSGVYPIICFLYKWTCGSRLNACLFTSAQRTSLQKSCSLFKCSFANHFLREREREREEPFFFF